MGTKLSEGWLLEVRKPGWERSERGWVCHLIHVT
jgi:hypothetical protein